MSCKVIGAKLIRRVHPFVSQIGCPLGQLRHVETREVPVSLCSPECRNHQDQVATLLNWHLIQLVYLTTAVDLAIRKWVGAQIMGSKREMPAGKCRVSHDR